MALTWHVPPLSCRSDETALLTVRAGAPTCSLTRAALGEVVLRVPAGRRRGGRRAWDADRRLRGDLGRLRRRERLSRRRRPGVAAGQPGRRRLGVLRRLRRADLAIRPVLRTRRPGRGERRVRGAVTAGRGCEVTFDRITYRPGCPAAPQPADHPLPTRQARRVRRVSTLRAMSVRSSWQSLSSWVSLAGTPETYHQVGLRCGTATSSSTKTATCSKGPMWPSNAPSFSSIRPASTLAAAVASRSFVHTTPDEQARPRSLAGWVFVKSGGGVGRARNPPGHLRG